MLTSPLLRLLLTLIILTTGAVFIAVGHDWGWGVVVLGLGVLWAHARDGGVGAAFAAFKRGDLNAVRHALRYTLAPGLLSRRKRAYHHWMQGVGLVAECRFPAAREQLLLAAAGDIQTENDRSLIQCLLAEVAMRLEDWAAAQEHLRLARKLDHHARIDDMIGGLEQRLHGRVTEVVRAMVTDH